jgi:hypothetical protein
MPTANSSIKPEATTTLNPAWVVVSALFVINSVAIRRCCVRPGGLFHRWVKESIRRKQSNPNNAASLGTAAASNAIAKALLQYSGFCVLAMALMVCLLLHLWILPDQQWYAIAVAAAIVLANALDEWNKTWESKRQDVFDFRVQLRQSLLKDFRTEDGNGSDSSQSYCAQDNDLEKYG